MGNIFRFDSPFVSFMNKLVDWFVLNLLATLCSLPIVTAGASICALHYACMELRQDNGSVFSTFFKAFKDNFKKGTLLWLIFLGVGAFVIVDFQLAGQLENFMGTVARVLLFTIGALVLMASLWLFPLQAKYENTLSLTIKNAFLLALAYLPKTIAMLLIAALPVIALLISVYALLPVLVLGYVLPVYWNGGIYTKVFALIDQNTQEKAAASDS